MTLRPEFGITMFAGFLRGRCDMMVPLTAWVKYTQAPVILGAAHLFEEPGALDKVVVAAGDWFKRHVQTIRNTK
jgi:hypothetical protein